MTTAPSTDRLYTAEELLTMEDGERYELDDGVLVDTEMSGIASVVTTRMITRLGPYVEAQGLGHLLEGTASFRLLPTTRPNRVPRPDIAFVRMERAAGVFEPGHLQVVPDLAVEVVSEHDNARYLYRKVTEYLDAGVGVVWVAYPDERHVVVYSASGVQRLTEDDTLDGGDVLPGFAVRVGDLFPPPLRSEAR